MSATREAKYYALANGHGPYLLALVRWPDVALAVTARQPAWREDQGLFELPYEPRAKTVSVEEAERIAAAWSAEFPVDPTNGPFELAIHRRVPPNWADLTPVEKRAWSLGRERTTVLADTTVAPATAQRRRHDRVGVAGSAVLGAGGPSIVAELVDVSAGGICVVVSGGSSALDGLRPITPIVIERRSGGPTVSVESTATVAWRAESGGNCHLGISFGELTSAELERITGFLAEAGAPFGPAAPST